MTLLEILVRELPKRGGWPDGIEHLEQYTDGSLFCGPKYKSDFKFPRVDDYGYDGVTREQYEAAYRLCKQLPSEEVPIWNGEGLPPLGCECQYRKHKKSEQSEWFNGVVKYASEFTVVIQPVCYPGETVGHPANFEFRKISSEDDRKREELAKALHIAAGAALIDLGGIGPLYLELADKIIAGEIPHLKIV